MDGFTITGQNPDKPLFCAHIIKQTDRYDVALLFKNILSFLNAQNFQEYGLVLENFFSLERKKTEDIFSFFTRIQESVREVEKLEHLAAEVGEEVRIPRFMIVWKMLRAVAAEERFSFFTNALMKRKPRILEVDTRRRSFRGPPNTHECSAIGGKWGGEG